MLLQLSSVLSVSLGSRALRVTPQPAALGIPSPPAAQAPLAPCRGLPAALPPAPRSPPLRPRPACRRRTCSCCSSRGPLPAPSHSGAHSRPASRACVCVCDGPRAPTRARWGWEAAGGGLPGARAASAARGRPIGSRADDWGGPGHKPRPQRPLVPPSPAVILSPATGLSSNGWLERSSFCEILYVRLRSRWIPDGP